MVSKLIDRNADSVAKRLMQGQDSSTESAIEWLEAQRARSIMRRRSLLCALGGWMLVGFAATASATIAYVMSKQAQQVFGDIGVDPTPAMVAVPVGMGLFAAFVLVGGVVAWLGGFFPGWSRTQSAIEWSACCDAMTRLLTAGCSYEEAFRLSASMTRGRVNRNWLNLAADRVERGGPHVVATEPGGRDVTVLQSIVATASNRPELQWRIAADHFFGLASRRMTLLLQTLPMITTVLSGLLIWIAISTTLGWMWRSAAEMIRGLT